MEKKVENKILQFNGTINYRNVNTVTSNLPGNDFYDVTEPEMSSLLEQKVSCYMQFQSFYKVKLFLS